MEAWDYSPVSSSVPGGYVSFTFDVHVHPANDPPSIQGPSGGTWIGREDSKISLGTGGGIVLHDPDSTDSDSDLMEVKVTVGTGTLRLPLSQAGGLYLLSGDDVEGASEFWARGGLMELNRALKGLTYQAPEEWSGVDEMDVWVSDLGDYQGDGALESTAAFSVTVEPVADPPVVHFPRTVHYLDEDTSLALDFVAVGDADPEAILIVQVHPDNGDIEVQTGLSAQEDVWHRIEISRRLSAEVSGKGKKAGMKLRGTTEGVNAAIRMLMYTPSKNFAGQVEVSVVVTDETGLSLDDEIYFYVRPINDAPVIEMRTGEDGEPPVLRTTAGGEGDAILGITVADVDAGDSFNLCANFQGVEARNALSIRLSSEFGSISIVAASAIGVRVVDSPAAGPGETLFLQASVRSIQAALDEHLILYSAPAEYSGHDNIDVTVDDGGNCGTGGTMSTTRVLEVDVAPYEPPLLVQFDSSAAAPVGSVLFTAEGTPLKLPDIVVTGGSVGERSAVEVVILAKSGNVSLSLQQTALNEIEVLDGGELVGERLRIRGSPEVLTNALAGVSFEPRPYFFGCWDRNTSCTDDTPVRFSRQQGPLALARVYVVAIPDGRGGGVMWDGLSVNPHESRSIEFLKISVGWMNDPPTVDAPDTVVVPSGLVKSSPVLGIRVADADVMDAPQGLGLLDVNVSTSMGSKLDLDAIVALKNGLRDIGPEEGHIRLRGQPEYINNVLATITISQGNVTEGTLFSPGERVDEIVVVVGDMGFSGAGGEKSAAASIAIEAGLSTPGGVLEHDVFTLEKMLPLVSTTEGRAVAVPGLETALSGSGDLEQLSVIVSAKDGYLSLGPNSEGVAEAAAKEDWGSAVTLIDIVGGAEQTLPEVQVRMQSGIQVSEVVV